MANIKSRSRWLGTTLGFLALAIALVTLTQWQAAIREVAIPENRSVFVAAFLVAVLLGVAAFVFKTRWFGAVPALLAVFVGLLLPFTVFISPQRAAAPIQVGDTIPAFRALDAEGQVFDSARLDGKLLLIKFFRAHW